MTAEEASEICRCHEEAMENTPQKIVDLIFSSFPYGVSHAQIDIILEEVKELINGTPVQKSKYK